jgi:McrBC 5-methylcytosine restriction system component
MSSHIVITEGCEVSPHDCDRIWDALPEGFLWEYDDDEREKQARYFGLMITAARRSPLATGFFVGISNLPGSSASALVVRPRFSNLDFAHMFAACADDPIVAQHLSDTFFVWPEEPSVSLHFDAWLTPLLVLAFLQALDGLCRRHLRRNYIRVVENLQGRAKGRIRVGEHVRQNVAWQRQDRVVCEYGRFDDDCLENRLLRAALEVGAAYLIRSHLTLACKPIVRSWIAGCRAALANVRVVRISPAQFKSVRAIGGFRHYRRSHRLAQAVLQHVGIDPQNLNRQREDMQIPPFTLCTYELFERYAEAMLRKVHGPLWAGYREKENNLPGRPRYRVRPDFIVREKGMVVDCKYKLYPQGVVDERERADVYQIVAYSSHRGVIECVNGLQGRTSLERLLLLYPEVVPDQSLWGQIPEASELDNSFETPLVRTRLYCPGTPA